MDRANRLRVSRTPAFPLFSSRKISITRGVFPNRPACSRHAFSIGFAFFRDGEKLANTREWWPARPAMSSPRGYPAANARKVEFFKTRETANRARVEWAKVEGPVCILDPSLTRFLLGEGLNREVVRDRKKLLAERPS